MSILQAIILGIVQGVGEFLPISSSAHLIVMPWIFGWQAHTLTFDVALHFGTLIAVVLFFWKDWLGLIKGGIKGLKTFEGKMFWFIIAASIPGALAGKLFEQQAEQAFRSPLIISITLSAMGIILYIVDKYSRQITTFKGIGFLQAIIIGVSQAFAIIPGVSRSGVTMSAGRFLGLTRESAARYSFLLSAPIIFGAALFKAKDIAAQSIDPVFIVGMITSAFVGFISIKFLLKYLEKSNFNVFVVYRLVLAGIVLGLYVMRGV